MSSLTFGYLAMDSGSLPKTYLYRKSIQTSTTSSSIFALSFFFLGFFLGISFFFRLRLLVFDLWFFSFFFFFFALIY